MPEVTDIQRRVFEFIRDTLAAGDPAPTSRELASAFGWRSKRAAERHIEVLIHRGWLASQPGKARSLRLARTTEIPLLGTIPAGFGDERAQECTRVTAEAIAVKPTRNTFYLAISGDSMIGKNICDGDIGVFEHGMEPRAGQVVAALIDRKSTLKTFMVKGGKPYLKAENPNYPDLIPAQELVIQGVMVALIRKFKTS